MTGRSAGDNGRRCFIQINTREADPVYRGFVCFSRIKKLLGRTENSCHDVLSDDTNSLRRPPGRSSNNCDLQFAKFYRLSTQIIEVSVLFKSMAT